MRGVCVCIYIWKDKVVASARAHVEAVQSFNGTLLTCLYLFGYGKYIKLLSLKPYYLSRFFSRINGVVT